jgi:hypothetical protein
VRLAQEPVERVDVVLPRAPPELHAHAHQRVVAMPPSTGIVAPVT